MMGWDWEWHQLDMQIACTSLQTNDHASTSSLNFYRLNALPYSQQQYQFTEGPIVSLKDDIENCHCTCLMTDLCVLHIVTFARPGSDHQYCYIKC